MSSKVLSAFIVTGMLSLFAVGCTAELVVRRPPPAVRVERQTAAPTANHFWVRGHWQWDGNDYHWVPGRWETRRAREVWVAGHWRESGRGWVWVPGRWVRR